MTNLKRILKPAVAAAALSAMVSPALAEETVLIAGWGAKSGPLRSFGVNSEAVLKAAVKEVNDSGGIMLADGTKAKLDYVYYDSACNAEQAISGRPQGRFGNVGADRHRTDLFRRRCGHVRRLPEDGW